MRGGREGREEEASTLQGRELAGQLTFIHLQTKLEGLSVDNFFSENGSVTAESGIRMGFDVRNDRMTVFG